MKSQAKETFERLRSEYYGYDSSYMAKAAFQYGLLDEMEEKRCDGKFAVHVTGYQFDGFYHYGGTNFLYVVFCGARTSGGALAPIPQYQRWSYYALIEKLGGSFLCLSDPMFVKYPKLKLGWFYGDEKVSGVAEALKIVKAICKRDHIRTQDVYFWGSSGGGTASLYAACLWPDSVAVALNPQLFIQNYIHTNHFIDTTGIDLHLFDPLGRNDLLTKMKHQGKSKYLILFNVRSTYDMEKYANSLISYFHLEQDSILSERGNLGLWLYDCAGIPDPHNSFETKSIFCFIHFIANKFKSGIPLNKYRNAILFANEQWHDIFAWKARGYESDKKCKEIEAFSYKSLLKYATARIDIKNIGSQKNGIGVMETTCGYLSPAWFDDDQGQGLVFQSAEGTLHLKLKVIEDGNLKIWLRGTDDRDVYGTRRLVWISYSDLSINGEKMIHHNVAVCHDSPCVLQKKVVNGELLEIYASWHPFQGGD